MSLARIAAHLPDPSGISLPRVSLWTRDLFNQSPFAKKCYNTNVWLTNHWIAALYVDNCACHIGDHKWMCTMICIGVRSHLQTPLGHPPSYWSCFGHVPLPWSKQSCKTLYRLFRKRLHYQPRVHHHFKFIRDYSMKTQWTRPLTVAWCKNGKNGCLLQLLKQGETGAKILRPRATSKRKS